MLRIQSEGEARQWVVVFIHEADGGCPWGSLVDDLKDNRIEAHFQFQCSHLELVNLEGASAGAFMNEVAVEIEPGLVVAADLQHDFGEGGVADEIGDGVRYALTRWPPRGPREINVVILPFRRPPHPFHLTGADSITRPGVNQVLG